MILLYLGGFALTALAAGLSRTTMTGWHLTLCGDILRWREAFSMFLFAPLICLFFWLLVRAVGRGAMNIPLELLAMVTIYFIACGMGMHDPADRLRSAYRSNMMEPAVWKSLTYFDEALGHWVFWAGFVFGTWILGLQQARAPLDKPLSKSLTALLAVIDLALAYVMLTNLWNEYPQTIVDLGVIALAALPPTVAYFVRRKTGLRRMPMIAVIVPVFWTAVFGTLFKWAALGD